MRLQKILQKLLLLLMIITLGLPVSADIVKPALVEISVFSDARVTIEIRTSIEALLTGINGRYRNTQEAPNTDAYDALRELEASDLRQQFVAFHAELLDGVELVVDGASIPLEIGEITIAPPGYTRVPRASVIHLVGVIPKESISLRWYYPLRFGDQAVRVRQVNEEAGEYHWSGHQWIEDDRPSEPFSLTQVFTKPTFWSVSSLYLSAGFLHIVPKGLDQPDHGNGAPDNGIFTGSRGLGQDTIWQSQGEHLLHERLLGPISGLGGAAELCTVLQKQRALCHPHKAPFIPQIFGIFDRWV